MKKIFIIICLWSVSSGATGLPVVDTNALIGEIRDGAYLLDSVSELVDEIGVASEEAQYLMLLQKQLNGLSSDLRSVQSFSDDTASLGEFQQMRVLILADRIRSFTNYLRKLKRVVATAASIRARPQAMLVALQLLDQGRQRDNDKMEAKMMAANELEKVSEARKKVRHDIERREQLENEKNIIFGKAGKSSSYVPLQVKNSYRKKEHKGLM